MWPLFPHLLATRTREPERIVFTYYPYYQLFSGSLFYYILEYNHNVLVLSYSYDVILPCSLSLSLLPPFSLSLGSLCTPLHPRDYCYYITCQLPKNETTNKTARNNAYTVDVANNTRPRCYYQRQEPKEGKHSSL